MLFAMTSRRVCQRNVSISDCSRRKNGSGKMGTGCSLDLFTGKGNFELNHPAKRNSETFMRLCVYVFLIIRRTLMNV